MSLFYRCPPAIVILIWSLLRRHWLITHSMELRCDILSRLQIRHAKMTYVCKGF